MLNSSFRSCYSLMESVLTIKDIVKYAIDNQLKAVALCDVNIMHGAMAFYHECKKNNIKPVFGLEIKIVNNEKTYSFVLFARNDDGYRKLMLISTKINSDEEITLEILNDTNLIVGLLDHEGTLNQLLSKKKDITLFLSELQKIIPHFKVGITNIDREYAKEHHYQCIDVYQKLGIKHFAYHQVFYLYENDYESYRCLKAIKAQTFYDDSNLTTSRNRYVVNNNCENCYAQEDINGMEAILNECNVEMSFSKAQLPNYENKLKIDSMDYLRKLCQFGLEKRLGTNQVDHNYQKRLNYELSVIEKMGYADYFLIVYDYVNYAKKAKIYVGPGRGSAAGSLISYCLGITQIDPLKYGLLFERFLNPERISLPDIDIDFPDNRRDEVIKYVEEKYGENHVSHIVTYGSFAAKQVLRDCGKVFFVSQSIIDRLCRMIGEQKTSLQQVYNQNINFRLLINNNKEAKRMFKVALKLEGLPRHISQHAAGIVLSKDAIYYHAPLIKLNDGEFVTQFSMNYLEELGLIKMDFLGLKNLTIIDDVVNEIKKKDETFDINKIPLDDPAVFKLLANADTLGVFQLESAGMKNLLKKMQIRKFSELADALALYRPGPMEYIDTYLDNRKNPKQINYDDSSLKDILAPTYGIMIYQEQIMQIVQVFAGFSLGKADILRKAISKKNTELMSSLQQEFIKQAISRGKSQHTAEIIFDKILKFAGYGFNKAHAVAYALIAYQMAYLKVNYASLFYKALLNGVINSLEKTKEYLNACRIHKIKILPPDINYSEEKYVIEHGAIRLPLSIIRNVGTKTLELLLIERNENGLFLDYDDFLMRCVKIKIGMNVIESLIDAGALDCFNHTRAYMNCNLSEQYRYAKLLTDNHLLADCIDKVNSIEVKDNLEVKLNKEYQALGFYLSAHPLSEYRKKHPKITHNSIDLEETNEYDIVAMVGKLIMMRSHQTKKGDKMMFLTMEDEYGLFTAILMPNRLAKYEDILEKFQVYAFKGKKGRSDGMIIDQILKIDIKY